MRNRTIERRLPFVRNGVTSRHAERSGDPAVSGDGSRAGSSPSQQSRHRMTGRESKKEIVSSENPPGSVTPSREGPAHIADPQWTQRGGMSISRINEKNPLTTTPTFPGNPYALLGSRKSRTAPNSTSATLIP